jgi:hypothetical protein
MNQWPTPDFETSPKLKPFGGIGFKKISPTDRLRPTDKNIRWS